MHVSFDRGLDVTITDTNHLCVESVESASDGFASFLHDKYRSLVCFYILRQLMEMSRELIDQFGERLDGIRLERLIHQLDMFN